MDSPRGFGLWGALGGGALVAGALAFFALKPAAPVAGDAPDAAGSPCEAPRHHDCTFYPACVEANVPCGPAGYALGFGEKYCERFKGAPFSPAGAAWADSVMFCLQKELLSYARPEKKSASCDEITKAAFDSHPACYTAQPASICFLPPPDVLAVFDTIGADELFSARTSEQIQAVVATCTVQVAEQSLAVLDPSHPQPRDAGPGLGTGDGYGSGHGGLGPSKQLTFWRELAYKYRVPGAGPQHVRVSLLNPTVSAGLPPEIVSRIVRREYGRIQLCYKNALTDHAPFEGTISVEFTIEKDGAASGVVRGGSTTVPDERMVACVTSVFSTLKYSAPESGKKVTVVFPLAFDTRDDAPAPGPTP